MCDFAQYYHILNWRSLPLKLAAALAAGLPPESRCLSLLHGSAIPLQQTLQAATADGVNRLCWLLSRFMGSTEAPPPSILQALIGDPAPETDSPVQSFDSPAEFEAAVRAAEGGEPHGN